MTTSPRTGGRSISPVVLRSALVAALGGFLFGFDTAVISGTTEDLSRVFDLNGFELGFTVATALIGTIAGAMSAGYPANRFGRKKVLFTIGILYFVSALGSALVSDWYVFMIFRFIGGIGVGAASVVAPIYTAEIAPARIRGRLVGLVQFNIVLGILLAYLSNWIIASVTDGSTDWRWMFGVEAVPALAFFLLVFGVPESPRWLFGKRQFERAQSSLQRLTATREEFEFEYSEIQRAAEDEARRSKAKLFTGVHRKVILLAVAIAAFNQLSGINAVLYYAPNIFRMAGAGEDAALLQSIVIGLVNLVATMLALTVIDKIGRRKLMLVGSIGYLVSLGSVALVFMSTGGQFGAVSSVLVLAGLMLFIASHAFGQGAVIWVFISEIFPNSVRAQGQSLGSFTHWFFAALTTWTFPWIAATLGTGTIFLIFFGFMVLQLVWVLRVMPETKQVPLEELAEKLNLPKEKLRAE